MPHLPSKRRRKVYSVRGCATRIRQPSVPFAGRQQTDEMSSVDWCWIDPMDREHYYRHNLIFGRRPDVGKMGNNGITLLWAVGLFLPPNDQLPTHQHHRTHQPRTSL